MYKVMNDRRRIGSFFYRFPTGERYKNTLVDIIVISDLLCPHSFPSLPPPHSLPPHSPPLYLSPSLFPFLSSSLFSGADVYDRVSIFLESMYRDMYKGNCGQNVIIVSHGLFCRLFLTRFYRWPV